MTDSGRKDFASAPPPGSPTAKTTDEIRAQNDLFRSTMEGGKIFLTPGIVGLGSDAIGDIWHRIRNFDAFGPNNDPYNEHDFGSFDYVDQTIFWKIDYYDDTLTYGSPDASDPSVTIRVLTIMLADEY